MTALVVIVLTIALAISVAGSAEVGPGAVRRRLGRLEGPPRPGPHSVLQWWRSRPAAAGRAVVADLPVALDAVGRALRAGASLSQALEEPDRAAPSPATVPLAGLSRTAGLGRSLRGACLEWRDTSGPAEVRLVAAALALAAGAGGQPSRAVEAVARSLRERAALGREVAAHAAQARLSALVIGVLPLAFLAWCLLTDPRTAAFLLTSQAGWLCLAAGLTLQATGVAWMRRLVRGVS